MAVADNLVVTKKSSRKVFLNRLWLGLGVKNFCLAPKKEVSGDFWIGYW